MPRQARHLQNGSREGGETSEPDSLVQRLSMRARRHGSMRLRLPAVIWPNCRVRFPFSLTPTNPPSAGLACCPQLPPSQPRGRTHQSPSPPEQACTRKGLAALEPGSLVHGGSSLLLHATDHRHASASPQPSIPRPRAVATGQGLPGIIVAHTKSDFLSTSQAPIDM